MKKIKKRKSSGSSGAKSRKPQASVDEYLASVPERARSPLKILRQTIRGVVPREATEVISYGIPAFKHHRVLVWYAAFSDHCSLFPTAAVIDKFKKELNPYSTSKGTIHFPLDTPLPTALIEKIVKARVKLLTR